jgi:tetratricopeptide (TPR) repeat protein
MATMRWFCVSLVLLCSGVPAAAGAPSLKDARLLLLRGKYAEAREQYETLAKDPQQRVAATVGVCRTWQSEGDYDKALAVVDAALKAEPKSPDLHAQRAELLYTRGRWDDAHKAAQQALSHSKEQFLAHWILAQLHRDQGDFKKAGEELLWFVRTYVKRQDANRDITDPDELLLVGLAELERARWDRRLLDQFSFVLKEVFLPLAKVHKDDWRPEYEAGRLYLEKYEHRKAIISFDKALAINPSAAEVLVSKGIAALQRYDVADAEELAKAALKINPHLTSALRLLADVHLTAGGYAEALKILDRARTVNPREEATLARIAACHLLLGKDDDFQAVVKDVLQHNPKAGLFYAELAERVEERKRYPEAEKFYKQALKLRPHLTGPRNLLGLLYMRLGQEDDAKVTLEEAYKLDPFNKRVVNTLAVLDHLDTYATLKTEHFLIRYDAKHDKVLAAFMGRYLEKIYDELAELFQFRPEGPILVEVFKTHEMFSGRVIALPDLRTVGACTGRMFAMCSPRDESGVIAKPFNWARVLRHEMVHVFNLEQTGFKVPHWFTEGLAVGQENLPMPPDWHQLLRMRVASGELMNLDNIHLGFIRPTSTEEWNLAYLQSFQYVEYLKKAYGKERIGDFLKAYGDGLDTEAALKKYCKVSKADFEKGYRKHLEELVKKFAGTVPQKVLSFKELQTALAKDPDNPNLNAQLAERFLLLNDTKQAKRLADAAVAKQPNHPVATFVLAQLVGAQDKAKVMSMLEAAIDPAAPEPKVLRLLGKLRFEGGEYQAAARVFEQGRKAEPYKSTWLVELAKVYKQTNESSKLIGVLIELAPMEADDLGIRRTLAKMLNDAGRHAEAERFAREALEIDVLDVPSQEALVTALRAQKKDGEATELLKLLKQ